MAAPENVSPQSKPSPPSTEKECRGRLTAFFTDWNPRYAKSSSRGLANDGNTCYRNSILTTLFHQPVFVNWLDLHLGQFCPVSARSEECLVCRLAYLSCVYWSENSLDALNEELKRFWRACSSFWDVNTGEQEDCMEFLTSLLQEIKTSVEPSSRYDGDISHMFQSITTHNTVCYNCGHASNSELDQTYFIGAATGTKAAQIEDCITHYMDEKVDGYNCDNCKQQTKITRTSHINESPEVLFVHVNRFQKDSSSKITRKVHIKEYLDLTKHLVIPAERGHERLLYRLTAVISHSGDSVKHGHYRSFVRRPTDKWVSIDDDSAKSWKLDQVLNNRPANFTPYIFVYNLQPYNPWPDDGTRALGFAEAGDNFSTQESQIPGALGPAEPATSKQGNQPGEGGDLQLDEDEDVQVQAAMGLPSLPEASGADHEKPRLTPRWEGQPAEVVVQVTMGDIVLTGVLRGLLKKGRKRPSLGAKPTGVSKRRPSQPASNQQKQNPKSSEVS